LSPDPMQRQSYLKMTEESDLSLELVILLVFGVFGVLFGLLLFKIHTGALPYNPDSTYGLFLVLISFQVITMGRTPFGDLRRSWALVLLGTCVAILGMAACFIPGCFAEPVHLLVGIMLFTGGMALLIQLFASGKKARTWMRIAGIPRHLTLACGLVYALTVVSGAVTLFPGITTNPRTAVLLIVYGMSFFYLCWCLRKVAGSYPPEEPNDAASSGVSPDTGSKGWSGLFREANLPLLPAILILLGILLAFLGLLLFPVNLGILAFSPDGQLGLLLTIMAIQMMALGDTPLGHYKRSWLMVLAGVVFAALGVVSCIVPGLLTGMLKILLSLLNIIGGTVLLMKRFLPVLHEIRNRTTVPVAVPPILKKLSVIQTALDIVAIAFGTSMLIPDLIPGMVIAGVLVINGLLLFRLASILLRLTGIQPGGNQS